MFEVLDLHKTLTYILGLTIWYVDMPDVIAGYGRLSDLNVFV